MNIAFFGSPEIAANLLESLLKRNDPSIRISHIFTQPDKPVGKRLTMTATPVKEIAQRYELPVFSKNLKEHEKEASTLLRVHDIELCLVYAYGEIISENMLSIPANGYINLHPSNLPKYRGPTPVAYTLMVGDKKTAISLIHLTSKLDSGPIISQKEVEIESTETRSELEIRLTSLATPMIVDIIHQMVSGKTVTTRQNEKEATYTRLLKKDHGYIPVELLIKAIRNYSYENSELPILLKNYTLTYEYPKTLKKMSSGEILYNYYRALSPWPGLWTKIETSKGEKRLKLTNLQVSEGKLIVSRVQLEGKKEIDFKTFNSTYSLLK